MPYCYLKIGGVLSWVPRYYNPRIVCSRNSVVGFPRAFAPHINPLVVVAYPLWQPIVLLLSSRKDSRDQYLPSKFTHNSLVKVKRQHRLYKKVESGPSNLPR